LAALHAEVKDLLNDPKSAILEIDRKSHCQAAHALEPLKQKTLAPRLGGSLIPWIDKDLGLGKRRRRILGTSREEWKGMAEANKILGQGPGFAQPAVPVDGFCVRIGAMRCHSQALTFKLKRTCRWPTSRP
jgi:aspartate-semialdehyde dehydrogenase